MIVDTSAITAILQNEPDAADYAGAIAASPARSISAASFVEAAAVIDSARNPIASRRFDDFLRAASIAVEPVTEAHAKIAREAYRDFGRGSGHPAKLNLGDCFAYALAKSSNRQLLFKGNDFVHTDVANACT